MLRLLVFAVLVVFAAGLALLLLGDDEAALLLGLALALTVNSLGWPLASATITIAGDVVASA